MAATTAATTAATRAATTAATAAATIDMSKVAVIQRTDGTFQVTYNGSPLYYYITDMAPGDVNGQGVGGVWFVISPDGTPIQTSVSGTPGAGGTTTPGTSGTTTPGTSGTTTPSTGGGTPAATPTR
jgi:hypothetical protein